MHAYVLAYVVLGLAICSVWISSHRLNSGPSSWWLPLLGLAVAIGLYAQLLAFTAAAAIATLALVALLVDATFLARWMQQVCAVIAFVLAFALALNRIPGFANATYLLGTEGPRPLQFNVGAAGLILLATLARPAVSAPPGPRLAVAFRQAALPGALTIAIPVAVALAIGVARPTLNLPENTLVYFATNLLFTCVAEEAAFRGIFQRALAGRCGSDLGALRGWLPVFASTTLFALAHAAAGPLAVLLVAIAGFGYGLTFSISRRLEPSILVHFLLNAVVFVFLKLAH